MKPETPKQECVGFIFDNGEIKRRRIDAISLYVAGQPQRTLRGRGLPDSLVLSTGRSQEDVTVLELFYEKVKQPPVVYTLPVKPVRRDYGRDAVIGVTAVVVFQLLYAFAIAVAHAMSN